jgi:hypothetical protein
MSCLESQRLLEREEWHKAYLKRLIERGVDEAFAKETLEAGMSDFDYEWDPADSADEELSCWANDADYDAG